MRSGRKGGTSDKPVAVQRKTTTTMQVAHTDFVALTLGRSACELHGPVWGKRAPASLPHSGKKLEPAIATQEGRALAVPHW